MRMFCSAALSAMSGKIDERYLFGGVWRRETGKGDFFGRRVFF